MDGTEKALAYLDSLQGADPPLAIDADACGLDVHPDVGNTVVRLCETLILAGGVDSILEIGSSIGTTACALGRVARELGARVTSIEIDEPTAEVARRNVEAAGLSSVVTIVRADALEAVPSLPGPFGMILQDGDKEQYLPMLDPLVGLLPPRGILVSDDILFPVMELPEHLKHWQVAIAEYNEALRAHPVLRTSWLPIGDGVAVSVRIG